MPKTATPSILDDWLWKSHEQCVCQPTYRNWLAKRYNMDVKVIRWDNQMNPIKGTEWCNQKVISFEPFAPDTYAQNGDAEHFGRWIMEKTRAMRLSANLPHNLWKKIVSMALTIQPNPTSVERLEGPLWGVSQLCFWQRQSLRSTKTASSPPKSIQMQGVYPNKVKKRLLVLPWAT